MDKLENHWSYALASAERELKHWAHSFNFEKSADKHTYADSNPHNLVRLADSFLSDELTKKYGGTRRQLAETRKFVIEKIIPVYKRGTAAGKLEWENSDQEYGSLETCDLHNLAKLTAKSEAEFADWFVEGFCYSYAMEELEAVKKDITKK